MSRYETDLAEFREVFGDDAEMIMRGFSVASSELEAGEALEAVLETMDAHRMGGEMSELQARIATVMWPQQGSLARLAVDVQTSLSRFSAGTPVRVLSRREGGDVLIQVLDRDQTVFPVDESSLAEFEESARAVPQEDSAATVEVAEIRSTEGARFWLNDRLGKVVSVSIYTGRGDGPPLLALNAIGELRHNHLRNGEDVYQVGNCSFSLPLDADEDAKMDDERLTVDLDLETWITVRAIGADGLPEE
jgi:hypothetical protein